MTDLVNTDPFLIFFGSFYAVLGLSIFLATKHWHEFIALFVENDALSLVLGVLSLPISLFIVVFYNNWDSLASIILMVLGYVSLAKALILLLRPAWIQNFLKAGLHKGYVQQYLWLDGLSGVVLGLAMLIL